MRGQPAQGQPAFAVAISRLEILAWGCVIFALTSPFALLLTQTDPSEALIFDANSLRSAQAGGNWPLYAIRLGAAMLALTAVLTRLAECAAAFMRGWPLFALLAWAILSLAWTDSPESSFNAAIGLAALLLFGLALSVRLPPPLFARALLYSGVIMAALSLGWIVLAPEQGIHQADDFYQAYHEGAWRGVFRHKNILGQMSAIYALAFLFSGPAVFPARPLRWIMIGLFLFLIAKSGSSSALLILGIGAPLLLAATRLSGLVRLIALCVLIAALFLAPLILSALLSALDRDATLTGRTIIWTLALDHAALSPWLGWGFLSPTYGTFTFELLQTLGAREPHNGYLDLWLGLGLLGLIAFVHAIGRFFSRLGGRGFGRQTAHCLAALVLAWLIAALAESAMRPLAPMAALGFVALGALGYPNSVPKARPHGG